MVAEPNLIPRLTVTAPHAHWASERPARCVAGRGVDAELRVTGPLISRDHAVIEYRDGWRLRDNDSLNGSYRDGKRIRDVALRDGDSIWLGDPEDGVCLDIAIVPVAREPLAVGDRPPAMPAKAPMPVTSRSTAAPPLGAPSTIPVRASATQSVATTQDDADGVIIRIGRSADNDVVIDDVLLSRHHATLGWEGHKLIARDLDSLNGTFVDGRRIASQVLEPGAIVTFGNTDFVFTGTEFTQYEPELAAQGELQVTGVGLSIAGGRRLLDDVSLSARPGSLTAIIGPSGAGKSTLSRIIAGTNQPTDGAVLYGGRDLHDNYDALRSRIGMVPQDDVVHRQLTVRQALGFAAKLRLPADTTRSELGEVVARVMGELGLVEHADTRVDQLSGGQRKRASVAMELLTEPTLLLLDEPTSGLDPALDRQVMTTLRSLADAGRTVLVVTHSLAYLDMCDQVLLLAPGGKPAFCGPPSDIDAAFGARDWAGIFEWVAQHPDEAYDRHRRRSVPAPAPRPTAPRPDEPASARRGARGTWGRQLVTLCRRQLHVMKADTAYLVFLAALPIALGVLALVVPGSAGFGTAGTDSPAEGGQLLVLLVLGACFMGASLSVRDLVAERAIYQRERAVGLAPSAYLMSKVTVFGIASWLQSAVLVAIVLLGKPRPGTGALIASGSFELYLDIAATAWCSAILGMVISALVKSSEQSMPLLVVVIMAELVMCGGMIPVTGRAGLAQISLLFPARWGYAAGASTVDLRHIAPGSEHDALWNHDPGHWWFAIGMLAAFGLIFAFLTWTRLRLPTRRRPA